MGTRVIVLTLAVCCASIWSNTNAEYQIETAIKITTEIANDMEETAAIYKKIKNEEAILAALKNSIRRDVKTKTSQFFANTLCAGATMDGKRKIKDYLNLYFDESETKLVEDIFYDTIHDVLHCKTTSEIVDLLWSLYENGDQSSYELMIRFQLQLFSIVTERKQKGDDLKFFLKFAYTLHRITQTKFYETMSASLKQRIFNVIAKLPPNMQYLLFYPHFCLMNDKYSEFLYTCSVKSSIDASSRYIWTWHEKRYFPSDANHIEATTVEWDSDTIESETNLLVEIKGITYGSYYYLMPHTRLIAGWDLPSKAVNTIFRIEFLDTERVAFYQGDYKMCATDEMYNSERRLVKGYQRGNYTVGSSECHWYLGNCKRK